MAEIDAAPDAGGMPARPTLSLAMLLASCLVAAVLPGLRERTARLEDGLALERARHAIAVAAEVALASATANEKSAMAMIGKPGLDEYATGWVTSIDHFKADIAELRRLAPAVGADEIDGALAAYVAAGEEMYRLKVAHESDEAIALSNSVAQTARQHILALAGREVESDSAAIAGAERRLAWLRALAFCGVVGTILAAAAIAASLLLRSPRRG